MFDVNRAMLRKSMAIPGVRAEQRRGDLAVLFQADYSLAEIQRKLGVNRNTLRRDIRALGLNRYTNLSEEHVRRLIKEIIRDSHRASGREYILGQLRSRGVRLQRWRIRLALVQLHALRAQPQRIRRHAWYEAYGPDWCVIINMKI